jgi:hypothetical protein
MDRRKFLRYSAITTLAVSIPSSVKTSIPRSDFDKKFVCSAGRSAPAGTGITADILADLFAEVEKRGKRVTDILVTPVSWRRRTISLRAQTEDATSEDHIASIWGARVHVLPYTEEEYVLVLWVDSEKVEGFACDSLESYLK